MCSKWSPNFRFDEALGGAEQLLLDQLAVLPRIGIAAVEQDDRPLRRPSAQCWALSLDLLQFGDRFLIMQDGDLAVLEDRGGTFRCVRIVGIELNLTVFQLSFATVSLVPARPTIAWQSADIGNGAKLPVTQCEDLNGDLPFALVGIVLADVFALQFVVDASFFRFRECDGIGFGGCEAGSRCEKSEQSQYGCGNTSHGDLR